MSYTNIIDDADRLKKQIDTHRPLSKSFLLQLKEYYRIGLTYSSNALEGNSLTETETKIVLEDGLTIGGKPLKDHFEAVGHSRAYTLMCTLTQNETIALKDILELHRLFYTTIDEAHAGTFRDERIIAAGTDFTFPPPSEIPYLMNGFAKEILQLKTKYHPIEYAAVLHLKQVTIHPFIDGNGRTARLLMNLALLQAGYVITIIPPILRSDYMSAVRIGNKGNHTPFINFLSHMVYESEKDYLRLLES